MKHICFWICLLGIGIHSPLRAQLPTFSHQDSLRGSITPERAWWDLTYYHLSLQVHLEDSTLTGVNTVQYRVLESYPLMQIDLQAPMQIEKVMQEGVELNVEQDGNAWFIHLPKQVPGQIQEIDIHFAGKPRVSPRPPWEGGVSWEKDLNGKPVIVTTCQGDGASLWWPCKDHMYDEPDSMLISVRVPKELMDVSNGRLRGMEEHEDDTKTWHWFVANPISNYVINLNIADYVHFSEVYGGEKGPLDCDYYVYRGNLEKAKQQFKEVPRMLAAFEHWFGPYPFYEDGFKLVEVPYPGMEHQSSVTYGNFYENGYRGRDVSQTGWGMKFDFIIVHEAGHEWFANSITYKDLADMWIHESFTAYSENLFVDYHFGKEASSEYVRGTRANILNDKPVVGYYGVNQRGSGDMYPKGANMLHMLRQIVEDDEAWRNILRGINKEFYHQTVTSVQIENFLNEHIEEWDLTAFFDQYLRDPRVPVLEYVVRGTQLSYRWTSCIPAFDMPIQIQLNGKEQWIYPQTRWQSMITGKKNTQVEVDPDFYVGALELVK